VDGEENMRSIFKRNKKLANQKRNKFDINAYMVFGLAAYLTVSAIIFIALMMYDTGTSSELSKQDVVATILQATLAAAALFGVSIAVLFVAKNTDKNAERQASAHELVAETSSLDRIERYLLEVITPLWKFKNTIDDIYVFAKAESDKLVGFCHLNIEEAYIIRSANCDGSLSIVYRLPKSQDIEYFYLFIIGKILSGKKEEYFGIKRKDILKFGYEDGYTKNPIEFLKYLDESVLAAKKAGGRSAIRLLYDDAEMDTERDAIFIGNINNGKMPEPQSPDCGEHGLLYNERVIIVVSWYFLKNIPRYYMAKLEFLNILRNDSAFVHLVCPDNYESFVMPNDDDVFDLPTGGKIGSDGQFAPAHLEALAKQDYRIEQYKEFHCDVERGFTGNQLDWDILHDNIHAVNSSISEIYFKKVMNVNQEEYVGNLLGKFKALSHRADEAMGALNENIVAASYVSNTLKRMYQHKATKFSPSSIETTVSCHALSVEDFCRKIMNKAGYDILNEIKAYCFVSGHGEKFIWLTINIVNASPYIIFDLIKPIEIIKKKILSEDDGFDATSSPFVDALNLDKFNRFIKSEDDVKNNVCAIRSLSEMREYGLLDGSIFDMSDEFWSLVNVGVL
jgi:hypothetical protein